MNWSNWRHRAELFTLTLLVGIALGAITLRGSSYEFFNPLVDLRWQIMDNYVTQPDENEMLEGALNGIVDSLGDQYSRYFTADELAQFEKHTTGSFSGIGAEIDEQDGQIIIATPLEDSPAFNAGILAGDVILEIDGVSAHGMTPSQAVEHITGPEGTQVTLKVRHLTGETADITITRQRIEIQTVKGFRRDATGHWDFMLDHENRIGYIRMIQFSEPTYDALKSALAQLQKEKVKGLILDLRYNPGGLLDSAINISDLFLDSGIIVSTKGRNQPEEIARAHKNGTLPDFPMVVLVNENSASAAEILSGALKDNHRAIILGTRTVGKGSVQRLYNLDDPLRYGGMKITTAYYYLPSGRNIHRHEDSDVWGVDPSDGYYVPMSTEQEIEMLKVRREDDVLKSTPAEDSASGQHTVTVKWLEDKLADPQLAAAYKTLSAKLETGEFVPVGKSNATILALVGERDNLQRQRDLITQRSDELAQEIDKLNQRISAVDETSVASDAKPDGSSGATSAKPAAQSNPSGDQAAPKQDEPANSSEKPQPQTAP